MAAAIAEDHQTAIESEKKLGELNSAIEKLEKRQATPAYKEKTPEAVRQADSDKLASRVKERNDVTSQMEQYKELAA